MGQKLHFARGHFVANAQLQARPAAQASSPNTKPRLDPLNLTGVDVWNSDEFESYDNGLEPDRPRLAVNRARPYEPSEWVPYDNGLGSQQAEPFFGAMIHQPLVINLESDEFEDYIPPTAGDLEHPPASAIFLNTDQRRPQPVGQTVSRMAVPGVHDDDLEDYIPPSPGDVQ